MSVTVVVCNYNGEEHLPVCLEALGRMRGEIEECIVVDNASTDASVDLLARDYPHVRVIQTGENAGPSRARNVGMQAAKTRWVLALDNDAIVAEDTLEKLLAAAEDSSAVLVQPRSVLDHEPERVHYDGGHLHYVGLIALRNFYTPLGEALGEGAVDVDCVIALCLLVDREKILEIGGYDERYFILFEDLDLSYRLRARGEAIRVVEDTIVRHRAGTPGISFREGPRYPSSRVFYHSRNRWIFLAKNYSARALLLAAPGLLTYELVAFLFALAGGHPWPWLRGKFAALRALSGLSAERRLVQSSRVVSDRELLRGGPLTVTPAVIAAPWKNAALGLLDGVLKTLWRLVRPFA